MASISVVALRCIALTNDPFTRTSRKLTWWLSELLSCTSASGIKVARQAPGYASEFNWESTENSRYTNRDLVPFLNDYCILTFPIGFTQPSP